MATAESLARKVEEMRAKKEYKAPADYEMYTPAGDRRCQTLVTRCVKALVFDGRNTRYMMDRIYYPGLKQIAKRYPEVYDTAVRESTLGTIEAEVQKLTGDKWFSVDDDY